MVQHFLGHTIWPDHFDPVPEEQKIADGWVVGLIESTSIPSEAVNTKIDTPVKEFSW